jgi:hypothetical protein
VNDPDQIAVCAAGVELQYAHLPSAKLTETPNSASPACIDAALSSQLDALLSLFQTFLDKAT